MRDHGLAIRLTFRNDHTAGESRDVEHSAAIAEHAPQRAARAAITVPVSLQGERKVRAYGSAERVRFHLESGSPGDGDAHVAGMGVQLVAPAPGQRSAELDVAADRVRLDAVALHVLNRDRPAD